MKKENIIFADNISVPKDRKSINIKLFKKFFNITEAELSSKCTKQRGLR